MVTETASSETIKTFADLESHCNLSSKRTTIAVNAAIPQASAYMIANTDSEKPAFGMETNGSEIQFIKLSLQNPPQYGVLGIFSLMLMPNQLYEVFKILRQIGQVIANYA